MKTCSRRAFAKNCAALAIGTPLTAINASTTSEKSAKYRWEMDISQYSTMLLPREHGQLTSTSQPIRRRYPSRDHCMQMAAFFNKESAVLVIGNDETAGVSDWTIFPSKKKIVIDFYGKAPEVITKVTAPNLESVAQLYRSWAYQQSWVRDRQRKTARLNFMTVAASSSISVDQSHLRDVLKYVDPPLGVWFTLWRKSPFDVMYPDYTPRENVPFRQFLYQIKNMGSIAFPYINGFTWDKNNTAFRNSGERVSIRDPDANSHFYKSDMQHLIYACPYVKEWRDKIVSTRNNLVDIKGDLCEGVYLDMLAASQPILCWSRDHGHAPGDPYSWVQGVRNILRATSGHIFVEGCAEVYLDLIDYPLMHLHTDKSDSVPFWQLVYGDQIPGWGWRLPHSVKLEDFSKLLPKFSAFGTAAFGSPWMTTEHERELMKRQFHKTATRHKI